MSDGFAVSFLAGESQPGEEFEDEVLGEFSSRFFQSGERSAGLAEAQLGRREVVVSLLEGGTQEDGFVEILDGVGELFLIESDAGEEIVGLSIGRIIANDGFELFGCMFSIA